MCDDAATPALQDGEVEPAGSPGRGACHQRVSATSLPIPYLRLHRAAVLFNCGTDQVANPAHELQGGT